jgi:feruloyl esterase
MQAALAIQKDEVHLVPANKLAMFHAAVVAACDGLDGLKDGLLSNPKTCRFDPQTLLCKGADTTSCLTGPQIESVRAMYAPAKRKDGTLVYPGMPYGGETAWTRMADPNPFPLSASTYQYALHEDAAWNWRTFDLDRDVAAADEKLGAIDAINPDLRAFRDRGGKLLMYHGWADPLVTPDASLIMYKRINDAVGRAATNSLALFMVPGMGHCQGGPATLDQFDLLTAVVDWVEKGTAPNAVPATGRGLPGRSRPLCAYPQHAQYKGSGDSQDARNFECRM